MLIQGRGYWSFVMCILPSIIRSMKLVKSAMTMTTNSSDPIPTPILTPTSESSPHSVHLEQGVLPALGVPPAQSAQSAPTVQGCLPPLSAPLPQAAPPTRCSSTRYTNYLNRSHTPTCRCLSQTIRGYSKDLKSSNRPGNQSK